MTFGVTGTQARAGQRKAQLPWFDTRCLHRPRSYCTSPDPLSFLKVTLYRPIHVVEQLDPYRAHNNSGDTLTTSGNRCRDCSIAPTADALDKKRAWVGLDLNTSASGLCFCPDLPFAPVHPAPPAPTQQCSSSDPPTLHPRPTLQPALQFSGPPNPLTQSKPPPTSNNHLPSPTLQPSTPLQPTLQPSNSGALLLLSSSLFLLPPLISFTSALFCCCLRCCCYERRNQPFWTQLEEARSNRP